jgi:hypothetical protein
MKYVISGSRRITDYQIVVAAMEQAIKTFGEWPSLIIEGGQRTRNEHDIIVGGVDYLASIWAVLNGVRLETCQSNWAKYKLAAGPIRNRKMATMGDVLVAIPDAQSKGTRDMINAMRELEKPVFILKSK